TVAASSRRPRRRWSASWRPGASRARRRRSCGPARGADMSEIEILSYADAFSARAGERLKIRMSTEAERVQVRTVRVRHGDTNPRGPGLKVAPVDMGVDGQIPGRVQATDLG